MVAHCLGRICATSIVSVGEAVPNGQDKGNGPHLACSLDITGVQETRQIAKLIETRQIALSLCWDSKWCEWALGLGSPIQVPPSVGSFFMHS